MSRRAFLRSNTKRIESKVNKAIKKAEENVRSKVGSVINKELRATRRTVVDTLMRLTGLKRKTLNDRLVITRASQNKLTGRITPIFGRRLWMLDYPVKFVRRGQRNLIKLVSPLYNKVMRTGFMSADKSRLYLRHETTRDAAGGGKVMAVRAVRGRSVPRLFNESDMKGKFEKTTAQRIKEAVRQLLRKKG